MSGVPQIQIRGVAGGVRMPKVVHAMVAVDVRVVVPLRAVHVKAAVGAMVAPLRVVDVAEGGKVVPWTPAGVIAVDVWVGPSMAEGVLAGPSQVVVVAVEEIAAADVQAIGDREEGLLAHWQPGGWFQTGG